MLLSTPSNKRYGFGLLGLVGLVLTVKYTNTSSFLPTTICASRQAPHNIDGRGTGETTVVSHAPGFTLFENAYWKNHTWYFVTSRPWAFPELSMVMTNSPGYDDWSPRFHDGLARVLSLSEAEHLGLNLKDAEVVKGSTVSVVGIT
jgi:hypothetical protein